MAEMKRKAAAASAHCLLCPAAHTLLPSGTPVQNEREARVPEGGTSVLNHDERKKKMNLSYFQNHARWMRVLVLGACIGVLLGVLGVSAPAVAAVAPAHPAKIDPKCTGVGCNGTDPYATLCAGQPFDHEQMVGSAPITSEGDLFGQVQLWYSPLCQTAWARTVAWVSPVVLEATLRLPVEQFTTAARAMSEVSSPQAFVPLVPVRASGQILRNGRVASGATGLVSLVVCGI